MKSLAPIALFLCSFAAIAEEAAEKPIEQTGPIGVVVFFVLLVTVGTLIQSALEKRKDARKAAHLRSRTGW